jgi:hypothetical protein
VAGEAKAVGAEGIGLDDLGPGLEIFVVNAANEFGLRQIELVVAAVDEDTLGVRIFWLGNHRVRESSQPASSRA